MNLLGLLPVLGIVASFWLLLQVDRDEGAALIRLSLGWAVYAVLITEVLSLVHAVSLVSLALAWGLPTLVMAGLLLWIRRRRGALVVPRVPVPSTPLLRLVAVRVVIFVVLTAVVAWFAPPNTWDALNYHMSRVAHWAQAGSVAHFATGNEAQNYYPPGASILALNLYVLAQGDRLVNFVQWWAMVACLVVAARLAARFGAGEAGRWFSAAFVVTLPVSITQATAVTTDYAVGLWIAIAVYWVVEIWQGRDAPEAWLSLGASAGLALDTKLTALPYLAPFALVLLLLFLRRRLRIRTAAWAALGLVLLAGLDVAYLARNLSTYGRPGGPASRVESQTNQILDGRVVLSNLVRNASLQLGTPSPHVNKAIALAVLWVHRQIGLDVNDPRTTAEGSFRVRGPKFHETVPANSAHAYLLALLVPLGVAARRRITRSLGFYVGLVLLTFVLLSAMLQWKPTGARYHLAFFVLMAPVAGVVLEAFPTATVSYLAMGALMVSSLPWMLGNHSRPVLSDWPGADVGSVLVVPRRELLFANAPYLAKPYEDMTELIKESGCGVVGVALPGPGLEYPLWPLLGAPRGDLRIEWLVAGTASARYVDPGFAPCAVICQKCPDSWSTVRGLPEVYHYGVFRLYLDRTRSRVPGVSVRP